MSYKNKYTPKQRWVLRAAYLWNDYLKNYEAKGYSFLDYVIDLTPWRYNRNIEPFISQRVLKSFKPIDTVKLKAKFQRANERKDIKNLMGVFQFMQDDLEEGMSYAIEENVKNSNLPEKIRLQVKYIDTELNNLKRMLDKFIPAQYRELDDYNDVFIELEEKLKTLKSKKSKP